MRTVEELEALLDEKTRYADGAAELVASLTRSLELAEAEIEVLRKDLRAMRKERDEARADLHDALRVLGEVSASAGIPTDAMFEDPTVITRRMR